MKNLLSLYLFFAATHLFAADNFKWTPVSDFTNGHDRLKFIAGKIAECIMKWPGTEGQELEFLYFCNQSMDGFGQSFTYLGRVEKDFLSYLESIDNKTSLVVVPGCGFGRTVLDALVKTRHVQFIANDLSKPATTALNKALTSWFLPSEHERVQVIEGDVFDMLKTLPAQSVDAFFCTNLIHFFAPDKIEQFFDEMRRTLKANGKAFITWQGFDFDLEYNLANEFPHDIFLNIVRKNISSNTKYPSYVDAQNDEILSHQILKKNVKYANNFISQKELQDLLKICGIKVSEKRRFRLSTRKITSELANKTFWVTAEEEPVVGIVERVYTNMFVLENDPNFLAKSTRYSADFIKENPSNANKAEHQPENIALKSCDQCHQLVKSIKRCGGCKTAQYCGADCQKIAWPHHKSTCKSLAKNQ